MAIFELKAKAKKEVEYDLMDINISFQARANSSSDCSKKVMDECERFLIEIEKDGVAINEIKIDCDNVEEPRYSDDYAFTAQRSIIITRKFDMEFLNYIKKVLQDGKYEYDFDVDFSVLKEDKIRRDLSREAIRNSKIEAEALADALGMAVIGVKKLGEPGWSNSLVDKMMYPEFGTVNACAAPYEKSNQLKADTKEISVELLIKWEIA